jgi:Protein of unknown function (DUF4232)
MKLKVTLALTATLAFAAPAIALASAASATPAAISAPACGNSLETWFAPEGSGFAGGIVYVVEFSNIGKATCTVKGFPTVKLTSNGKQVGFKATDGGAAPATVTLKSGQTSHVVLTIMDAGALCKPVPTNGLSVQPPGQSQAASFALASAACRGKSTMGVDAINPGTGVPHFTTR